MISGGQLPIPSKGWGGVEVLLTNYLKELENQGHQVVIANTTSLDLVESTINDWNPDFVHLHYDVYTEFMSKIKCKKKAITSHYPYIDYPHIADKEGYSWIYEKMNKQTDSYVFSLSGFNKRIFEERGLEPSRVHVWKYGIPHKDFRYSSSPEKPDRSICLGKIEPRKRQSFLQTVAANIDFAGPLADDRFWKDQDSYLGQWTREQVHDDLTDYANLILLSDGESAPQVVYEALMAGCGLVVSKEASANLNVDLPFIDVVDNSISRSKLLDVVEKNREISIQHREEIRKYGIDNFSIEACVTNYVSLIESLGNLS